MNDASSMKLLMQFADVAVETSPSGMLRKTSQEWQPWCCCWLLLLTVAAAGQETIVLAGSGSSLAGPLFAAWESTFNRLNTALRVAYLPTNSSEGIRQIARLQADFAVGEIPLTKEQMVNSKAPLKQVPIAVVYVVPIYNLPGLRAFRFSGEVLAQVYLGKISRWNDSRIAAINPGIDLPELPILVVDRPAGSGTRYVWTEFLSQCDSVFRKKNAAADLPKRIIASSSKAMAERVALTPGAIGYVEQSYAVRNGLAAASVRNRAGKFVQGSGATVKAACKAREKAITGDVRESLINAEGPDSYPLVSFTWVFFPNAGLARERRVALRSFLAWSLKDGQTLVQGSGYLPLPSLIAAQARAKVESGTQ